MSDQGSNASGDKRTCAFPGDQEHDHAMCEDVVVEDSPEQKLARVQAAGLRAVADMVEANPHLSQLLRFAFSDISAYAQTAEELAAFTRAVTAAGARVVKDYPENAERHMSVRAHFGPVQVRIHTERAVVCDRVVTGVEKVTESVPDPAYLAGAPMVEVEREVETVEWVCRPILAGVESSSDGA